MAMKTHHKLKLLFARPPSPPRSLALPPLPLLQDKSRPAPGARREIGRGRIRIASRETEAWWSSRRGEELTSQEILDAPGEVVGKSGYGTLYRAGLGVADGKAESHRWEIIYKLSLGIARGLDYLHNGLQKPITHGNLKSKNILLDSDHQPLLSDFGLHLLLNPTAAQEMLEASSAQGYKAPELIKMKNASKETDIYSLGVIYLEILTRKEPMSLHLPASLRNMFLEHKISEEFSFDLADESKNKNNTIEESLRKFFHLAMACCSPSPVLRPDIKQIIRKLEEL
ncbi:uncharacterized protein A4U43_C04F32000 [Asparagus officinalis]|uniref:Protein kinase domain-containing protein n=1 Tax=Asparagus officinalis TaxID=4686 RepID=A0A5P1FA10_ASPOF|nr:uncharacterized protein A4U43_C04F32000 [Asparagus officinalis]